MVTQGVLNFQYQSEESLAGMTALGGLPLYLDLTVRSGMIESIRRHVTIRRGGQGWTDEQMVMSLILLNLAGGERVSDLEVLESDEGFSRLLRRVELQGLPRKQRRELERRWRKERRRAVPSSSPVFRYLAKFDEGMDPRREKGTAFIPSPSVPLVGLRRVNGDLAAWSQRCDPVTTATLDTDATLVASHKSTALFCYKGMSAYQPTNVWWAEKQLVLHTEFRDGNVPAGKEQLRVLCEAMDLLPAGVEKVRWRSDSAGYEHETLEYLAEGRHPRFGQVEFAVSADVTDAFRRAVSEVPETEWQVLHREVDGRLEATGQQWAEVCFVPKWAARSKGQPDYRFLAIREPLRQETLPGVEEPQLPFPVMSFGQQRHKLFGVVTNLAGDGEQVIRWHRERCGKSEEAHAVMKDDLAGGRLPSSSFGENAAWWWCMILALNLNNLFKTLVLPEGWQARRMKAVRFALINIPGRVLERSRQLLVRMSERHPSLGLMLSARSRILSLEGFSPG